MTPPATDCLVCGRHRPWWATGWWRHQLGRVQPFPRGALVRAEPVLLAAPVCCRLCSQGFVEVLGGKCELSWWELQRRAARPPVPADLQRIEVRL